MLIVENSAIIAMHLTKLVADLARKSAHGQRRPQTRLHERRHSNPMSP